jgi:hypothetical protein
MRCARKSRKSVRGWPSMAELGRALDWEGPMGSPRAGSSPTSVVVLPRATLDRAPTTIGCVAMSSGAGEGAHACLCVPRSQLLP